MITLVDRTPVTRNLVVLTVLIDGISGTMLCTHHDSEDIDWYAALGDAKIGHWNIVDV